MDQKGGTDIIDYTLEMYKRKLRKLQRHNDYITDKYYFDTEQSQAFYYSLMATHNDIDV